MFTISAQHKIFGYFVGKNKEVKGKEVARVGRGQHLKVEEYASNILI